MWNKKFSNLYKLLRYLEQTETYNHFKENEDIKNEKEDYSKTLIEKHRLYKEIIDFDKMIMQKDDDDDFFEIITHNSRLESFQKEYNEFLEKKKKLFICISSLKHPNLYYVRNILRNNLNFMNFKLDCIRELKEIFKSCDEAVIFKVIEIVEEWYKEEKWFNKPEVNKFMYYGTTLYYALRRNIFFRTYNCRGEKVYYEDLKTELVEWNHKEELENSWFKCINNLIIENYKNFI